MARIAGVDLPRNKRIDIALTYIFGIGRTTAVQICDRAEIPCESKTDDLAEADVNEIVRESVRLSDLHRDAGQDLLALGSAVGQSRLLTADVRFIDLHHPGQPVPARAHQHRPQSMQHRPRGLVGADLQRPLQGSAPRSRPCRWRTASRR